MEDQNKRFTMIVCVLLTLFLLWMLCTCSSSSQKKQGNGRINKMMMRHSGPPNQPMPPPSQPTDPTAVFNPATGTWTCGEGCKCDGAGLGQHCIDGTYMDTIDVHEDYTTDFDGLYRKERVSTTPLDFGYDLVQVTGDWTN